MTPRILTAEETQEMFDNLRHDLLLPYAPQLAATVLHLYAEVRRWKLAVEMKPAEIVVRTEGEAKFVVDLANDEILRLTTELAKRDAEIECVRYEWGVSTSRADASLARRKAEIERLRANDIEMLEARCNELWRGNWAIAQDEIIGGLITWSVPGRMGQVEDSLADALRAVIAAGETKATDCPP